jgi:hypothetical protein
MLMKTKMIVRSLVSIAFFLLLSACTSVNNQDTRVLNYDKSDKEYISLVAKVKSGQAQASDYDMLIRIFPLSSFYKPKS